MIILYHYSTDTANNRVHWRDEHIVSYRTRCPSCGERGHNPKANANALYCADSGAKGAAGLFRWAVGHGSFLFSIYRCAPGPYGLRKMLT